MASPDPDVEAAEGRGRPRRTVVVLGAAVVSGVAGYVVLVLTARCLAPAENADFLVFWGSLFGVFGVLVGITTECTRAVFSAGRPASAAQGVRGVRVVPVSGAIGVALVSVLGATGAGWGPRLYGGRWPELLAVLILGVGLFAVHSAIAGALAGRSEWDRFAGLVAAESTMRVLAVAAVAVAGVGVGGFALASAAAAATWVLLLLASSRYRSALAARADVGLGAFLARVLGACSAAGASAVVLVGFPVLLRLTTPGPAFAGAAPVILAVSLSRAPLLVPLGAYQSVAVTKVMTGGLGALRGPALVIAAVTAAGVLLAYPLGPSVLRLLNPQYDVSGAVFSGLVLAAGLVALLTLSGAASLALDRHAAYVIGWVATTIVTVGILSLPGTMTGRTVTALVIAPLVGIPLHLVRPAALARLRHP